ncbi:MAG: c-type cytochrome biogenesis protein CcsB [Burkholderiales bacterium]
MSATPIFASPLPLYKRLSIVDWLFALALVAGSLFALQKYGSWMDAYEKGFVFLFCAGFIWLGWAWKPIRVLLPVITIAALFAISLYHGDATRAKSAFFLKYMISSQSAIMWMSVLFIMATLAYWFGTFARSEFSQKFGRGLTWSAVAMGLIGLLVRWYESYLIGADVGHIPISNLYEVFILFSLITALMYLYYEDRYQTLQMGGFVLLIISAAVGFLLWYTFDRGAHEIQPLVPALQSYWMKIHVPANFVGYGAFSLAAMLGVAYLLAVPTEGSLRIFWILAGVFLIAGILSQFVLRPTMSTLGLFLVVTFFILSPLMLIAANRGVMANHLPKGELIDDIMYKSIAIGFAFFTIATILGAMWAAEAWGGYWSWDPKETWALIVWLNYAAWLHIRLTKGLRGPLLAWWAVIGLLVTTFAFLGVNMFLSGLHSYGTL